MYLLQKELCVMKMLEMVMKPKSSGFTKQWWGKDALA
jgi:hypothetical protein